LSFSRVAVRTSALAWYPALFLRSVRCCAIPDQRITAAESSSASTRLSYGFSEQTDVDANHSHSQANMQPAKKEAHLFVCGQCGFESRKWLGRCPDCGAWDSLTEQRGQSTGRSVRKTATAQPLSGAVEEESARC
jgi:predicted RNA-binding Zn-ribbon protein involved in translation (DUF1610 family)